MSSRDENRSLDPGSPGWWPELGWPDWLSLDSISVLLLTLCVVCSRPRLFWSDETFGFTVLRDPSLAHTLRGWWEGADGGGLLYYLTGHVWFRVFGASPLVLRLLSTTSFLAAIVVLWVMARRFFVLPVVAVAVGLVFFLPSYVLWQETNGRFYGLFLASASVTAACTMYAADLRSRSRVLVWLTFGAHACLVGSHILGLIYSGGLLAALVLSDLIDHRRRLMLYASVPAAWLVVLPLSFHAIRAATMVAQGVFWPTRPLWRDLLLGFFAYSHKLIAIAAALLILATARLMRGTATEGAAAPGRRPYRPIAVVVAGLVFAQLALFTKSRIGLSIYSDRYLLPLVIALVLLFCIGLTRMLGPAMIERLSRPFPSLAIALVCLVSLFAVGAHTDTYNLLYPGVDYPQHIERLLPPGRDVVVTLVPTFMLLRLVDPNHNYIFATDWSYDGAKAGSDLSGQRMMENVERGGFAPHEVLDAPEIVRETPEFTLLAEPGRLPWLRDRFEQNAEFEVTPLGTLSDWYPMTVWHIRCLHPATGCRL